MTAYNREIYIGEAIESVLASTYQNWELIIVDDCSTDTTSEIAKSFALNDSRIRAFKNEKNLGDYPNRNHAASFAGGEYMIYVDSDDKIFPDGIEKLVESILLYPNSSFGMYSTLRTAAFELQPAEAIHEHFFERPFLIMGPGGTIIRRIFFEQVNGYPEKYGPANDMYFNIKVACFSSIVLLPFKFISYRRHAGQEINNWLSYLPNNYLYLKDAMNELPLKLSPKEFSWIQNKNKRRFLVNISKYLFRTGNLINTYRILKLTAFSFRNAFEAVFHL